MFDEHAPEAEPAFLAPELMTADAPDKNDPKVQVYAAGVLGYELLTGKLALTPGQVPGPELSGTLGQVVRRALAADRRERIEDLRELHEEMERVQPRPPAEGERNILSALRNRFSRPSPEKEAVAKLIDKLHQVETQLAQLARTQARLEAAQRQSLEAIERFEDGQRRADDAGRRRQSVVAPAVVAGLLVSVGVLAAAWALGMIAPPVVAPATTAPVTSAPPAAAPAAPQPRPEPEPERRAEQKPPVSDGSGAESRSAQIDAGHEGDAGAAARADPAEADAGAAMPADAGPAQAAAPAPRSVPPPPVARPRPQQSSEAAMLHAVAISQVRRGEAALEQGGAEEALASFRAALENEPNSAVAFRGMGMAHAMLGNDAQALQSYEKYLRLAPKAKDAEEIRQSIRELKARAKQGSNAQ